MTNTELTQYIRHYVEKDKTKSAIMLTGEWGIGKSHYIKHELVSELKEKSSTQCVIVSLYGMKNVNEISKSIYLELRIKPLPIGAEIAASGKVVGKTVIKGVTSFFGVDLTVSEDDMEDVYKSIDLSEKLIILEDIERCQIDILEVLGYINNLVEQDGAKVLMVANEDEFIVYEPVSNMSSDQPNLGSLFSGEREAKVKVFTEKTKRYLSVKEKTVGDTLQFEGDVKEAVRQIIVSFDNPLLNKFAEEGCSKDICRIFEICKSNNLRSFIFACQKTADIFEKMQGKNNDDFVQCIFYGIIFFSLRMKTGRNMQWDGNEVFSVNLGHENTPLFKFCYEYIMWQKLDVSKIAVAAEAFSRKKLYDKNKSKGDPDLEILFNYHEYYEEEVVSTIRLITERLKNPEDISFYDYGAIATHLVQVKNNVGCDIEIAKDLLIKNLEGRGNELEKDFIFWTSLPDDDESAYAEYEELRKKMSHALMKDIHKIPNFDYLPEQAGNFYAYVCKNEGLFHSRRSFAKNLDMTRLGKMFANSSPKQKNDIRGAFWAVYRPQNIKQIFYDDSLAIEELLSIIKTDSNNQTDKIQKLQYKWFEENLIEMLNKLR